MKTPYPLSIRSAEQSVGFGVVGDLAFGGVPGERAAELQGKVGEDAGGGGDVALLDIGDGAAAGFDGGDKVFHVGAGGGGGVQFNILFADVLGILLALIDDIFVNGRFVFSGWEKVVPRPAQP